jgi:hypothetical protein
MSRMSEPLIPAFAVARQAMISREQGTADDLAIPAGELEPVRTPAQVGAHHQPPCHRGRGRGAGRCVFPEAGEPFGGQIAVQKRGDAAVAVGRPRVGQPAHPWQDRRVLRLLIAPTRLRAFGQPFYQVRSRHAERLGYGLHRKSSLSGDAASNVGFFARERASAARRCRSPHHPPAPPPLHPPSRRRQR